MSLDVINPATGEQVESVSEVSPQELNDVIARAQAAFPAWSADVAARRATLLACAETMRAHARDIARVITLEQGKPLAKAEREVMGAARWFEVTAGLEIPLEVVHDDAAMRVEVRRVPFGVVGAITPWNYPVMLAAWKIAPALLAGNCVVLKPSPFTPLATLRLGALLKPLLPDNVLHVVAGGDELGVALTTHPAIRMITFTGSTAAGRAIATATAGQLKRLTLELGGNDAAIVLPGTDIDAMAEKLFWAAFDNSGQICAAVKRVYVHQSQHDRLVDALAARIGRTVVGDGLEQGVELGPLSNRPQFERVVDLVADARARGGTIVTGGAPIDRPGFFFAPTLVTGLADDARLVAEEQFGPALPILSYTEEEEALARANATDFGLSGSVWGKEERALELGARMECGTLWINQHMTILPHAPLTGTKLSGLGVANGHWGLAAFSELRTVQVAR